MKMDGLSCGYALKAIEEMESKHKILLLIDGVINLVLGILLLLFPKGQARCTSYFYLTTQQLAILPANKPKLIKESINQYAIRTHQSQ